MEVALFPSTTPSIAVLRGTACDTTVVAPGSGGAPEMVLDRDTGGRVTVLGALSSAPNETLVSIERGRWAGALAAEFVGRTAFLDRMARRFMFLYPLMEEGRHSIDGGFAA